MGEEQCVAGLQVRLNRFRVDLAGNVVGHEHHDDVGLGSSGSRIDDAQALGLSLGAALRTLGKTNADVDTRVAKRQRVCVTLRAVADDGDNAVLDDGKVGVLVIEHLGHVGSPWVGVGPALRRIERGVRLQMVVGVRDVDSPKSESRYKWARPSALWVENHR